MGFLSAPRKVSVRTHPRVREKPFLHGSATSAAFCLGLPDKLYSSVPPVVTKTVRRRCGRQTQLSNPTARYRV